MSNPKLDNGIKFFYGIGAAPYGIKDNGFSYFFIDLLFSGTWPLSSTHKPRANRRYRS